MTIGIKVTQEFITRNIQKTLILAVFLVFWQRENTNVKCSECDLASRLEVLKDNIKIGKPFRLKGIVQNIIDSTENCTKNAKSSTSIYELYYRVDSLDHWEKIEETKCLIIVEILDAGRTQETTLEFVFNRKGEYKFKTICDIENAIKERDEMDRIEHGKNNTCFSEVITVHSDDYYSGDWGKPAAEFVRYRNKNQ